jgi:hypothetical protein
MKYYVYASEIVHYLKEIEAESQEQAEELAQGLEWDYGDAIDGQQFQIEEISEA